MLIGYDIFALNAGGMFSTVIPMVNYTAVQMSNMLADEIYVSENTNLTNTTTKPTSWGSLDMLNADFLGTLEGGSISGNGQNITSVVIQSRNTNGLTWNSIATIPYVSGSSVLFQYTDSYVQNGSSYAYVLIPYINNAQGISALNSSIITVNFDSTFLTDKNNNYMLMYDIKQGSITNNVNSKIFEPLDSQYPIVQYGSLNYRSGKISATLLTTATLNSSTGVNINQEVILRQNLLAFLNNRQAKLLRTRQGENVLINIVDKSSISFATSQPIAMIDFSFVEIGGTDSTTLQRFGL